MSLVDSHQHFWHLGNSFTAWPTADLKPIYRNFLPDDFGPIVEANNVDATILVQAAPNSAETEFLLGLADECDFVKGVVGWLDFEAEDACEQLAALAARKWLKGVRPMVQDIEDDGWLLRPQFGLLYFEIARLGLVFDALVRCGQLPKLTQLAGRYPGLPIVLDHAGKPDIAGWKFADWAAKIEKLSKHGNVSCKLSGLWTQAGDDRSATVIQPYVAHLLECFGASRLLWGSDWPVAELAGNYRDWLGQCRDLLQGQSREDRDAIFGGNARRIYDLD